MKDNRIFADAFNYLIYGGRQIIAPEKLHPLDTTIIGLPYGADGAGMPVQKFRDELKYLTAMEDDSAAYILLGIENQTNVNYAMPIKDMVYDALQYAAQVEKAAKSHRKAANTEKKPTTGEYLTGFYKEDRLLPVITLVVYFGAEEWDAPMSLHDMLSVDNPEILSLVPDYRINLIAPAEMSNEEIDKFKTNLREVMLFIKYSKDKNKLNELLTGDEKFKSMDRNAAEVINTVTGSGLKLKDKEDTIDMCKAIEDMMNDSRSAGRSEGHSEGLAEGRIEGRNQGRSEGLVEGCNEANIETAKILLTLGKLTFEEIAESTHLSLEKVQELSNHKAV
jgi:hypothetical protein